MKIYKGRNISRGVAIGKVLVGSNPISFYGGIDLETGIVVGKKHMLRGKKIDGKILIFPRGRGSTVGSYIIYRLAKNGLSSKALVNIEAEPIVAVGAIISNIPMIDKVDEKIFQEIKDGNLVEVNGDKSILRCIK